MTTTPGPGTRAVCALRRIDDVKGAVCIDDVYDTDIDDLWSTLTDPRRLARWIATVDGHLRLGGRIHARFTSGGEFPGRIDVCEPPRHLLVTWNPATTGEPVMEAMLTPAGAQTRLVIEDRGIPLTELAEHGAGWQAHVEDLVSHLSGRPPCVWHDRWVELTPSYKQLASELR